MMKMKIVLEANVPNDLDRCDILPEYFLRVDGNPPILFTTNYSLIERSLIDEPPVVRMELPVDP